MSDKEVAPQVLEHPGARPIRRLLMDTSKSSAFRAYVLVRVNPEGPDEALSEHPDFGSGWSAGTHAVGEDRDHAFSLYANGRRVARFGHSRLQPRAKSFDWMVL
jgi:hypothetical protein